MIFQCFIHIGTLLELRKKAGLVLHSGQWLISLINFLRLIGANFFLPQRLKGEGFTSITALGGSYSLALRVSILFFSNHYRRIFRLWVLRLPLFFTLHGVNEV